MSAQQWFPWTQVRLEDPFWRETQRLLRQVVLPYQWEILNDRVEGAERSGCLSNLRIAARLSQGQYHGQVFQDSDLYKWLEAVAYALALEPDARLEAFADEAIALMEKAQQHDGYLNTYYTLVAPGERFANLTEGHELYCAGHLIEAAVAYHQATGKESLLNIARRLADCLCTHFLDGAHGYPGHPEVELALVRLYEETGEERYLRLSRTFVDARGETVGIIEREEQAGGFTPIWGHMKEPHREYMQDHQPVREQRQAIGHAVRAMYLYSAMADLARLDQDALLRTACEALFEDTTCRQMYVTGGVGSCADGECFTTDFELPNETVYAETCASIGLMMFARRMWRLTDEPACYDVWERALYNTVLAGMDRSGQRFFYVNPLCVDPKHLVANPTLRHVLPERPRWFGTACCPPNLARCVLSMGGCLYARDAESFTVLSHIESTLNAPDVSLRLRHEGDLHRLTLDAPATTLRLRVPEGFTLACEGGSREGGYVLLRHPGGQVEYAYRLTPRMRILRADPRIAADVGKLCVSEGATVYCLEEADNGPALCELLLPEDAALRAVPKESLPEGMHAIEADGFRLVAEGWKRPYLEQDAKRVPAKLVFIPYSQWNNRGVGEMTVWVNRA